MTHRERFLGTFHFQPVDHIPDEEFNYWPETIPTWQSQGMPELPDVLEEQERFGNFPEDVDPGYSPWWERKRRADAFFGLERRRLAPVFVGLAPGFERAVIEEDDLYATIRDRDGAIKMIHKDGSSRIPKHFRFALETCKDWEEEFKKRLNPASRGRVIEDVKGWSASVKDRDYPLGIHVGSLFGWIRDWMGFENVCFAVMDDPLWIQEMMDHLTELTLTVIEPIVREVRFDYAQMWEDMCFNHGSILPVRLFEEWMVPRLSRITAFLKKHGCNVVLVDCDGNINELVPHWLDAGVNAMFPLEIRGGTDPIELREKYGHRVLLSGGVDKTALIAGKDAIRREVDRLKPVVDDGGFIPTVDHHCPPDVTYENFLFYLRYKREVYGIPEPEGFNERVRHRRFANSGTSKVSGYGGGMQ